MIFNLDLDGDVVLRMVLNVVKSICKGLDEGFSGLGGMFFDLSKAFDLVDHKIMLQN